MTEPRAMERFEAQLSDRVQAYTSAATQRRIDALEVARAAMTSQRASGWWAGRLGGRPLSGRPLGRRVAGRRLVVALAVAVVVIGVVTFGVGRPPADTEPGPLPDALRHSWKRPYAVAPGPDWWGAAYLVLGSDQVDYGRDPAALSRTAIKRTGDTSFTLTATAESTGCAIGEVGSYSWSLTGKDTVMTLEAIGRDACVARQEAFTGPWVRSDFPARAGSADAMAPGTYVTSSFDPIGDPATPTRLTYVVPLGWVLSEDSSTGFVIHNPRDGSLSETTSVSFLAVLTQPRLTQELTPGSACDDPLGDAPGVGANVDDLVAAIQARPGLVSTTPEAVKIGGYAGQLIDLRLASSWTGGCLERDGLIVSVPVVHQAGSEPGPLVVVVLDQPVRLVLVDLGNGRTLAISMFDLGPTLFRDFQAHATEAMSIVESFEFKRAEPERPPRLDIPDVI